MVDDSGPEEEAVVEVEVEAHGIYDDFYGAAVASIEERIFLSDVIVQAVLVSAGDGILHFRALGYLMGIGPEEFSVAAVTEGRDTSWDGHEAVLFLLDGGMGSASFRFADTTTFLDYRFLDDATAIRYSYAGELPPGDTIGANNPVWLPAESPSSSDTFITAVAIGVRRALPDHHAFGASREDRVGHRQCAHSDRRDDLWSRRVRVLHPRKPRLHALLAGLGGISRRATRTAAG